MGKKTENKLKIGGVKASPPRLVWYSVGILLLAASLAMAFPDVFAAMAEERAAEERAAGADASGAIIASAAGVTISGVVKTYNPGNATTIRLLQGETEIRQATIVAEDGYGQREQAFEVGGVQPGTYTLAISKPAHLQLTINNVVVGDSDIDLADSKYPDALRVMTLGCGDINGDGMVNDGDLTVLWQIANYNRNADDAANPLCDLNGDGMVNDSDLTILWSILNYNRSAVEMEFPKITDPEPTTEPSEPTTEPTTEPTEPSEPTTEPTIPQDGHNVFSVSNASGKPGDIVTVSVNLGGEVNLNAFEMRLAYDGDLLEYETENNRLVNETSGKIIEIKPLPPIMVNILREGGVVNYIKKHGNL